MFSTRPAPGSRHHRRERQPGGAKVSTFPGQNAVNDRSWVVSPDGAGHTPFYAWSQGRGTPGAGGPPTAWPGTRSISRQVSREVQTRRPAASEITISYVVTVRPPCSRVATPVTSPVVAAR